MLSPHHRSSPHQVHSFLITNMAIGDLLMGVYLLIVAVVDARYRGVYIVHDVAWRRSNLCRLAGFLSTFSSEFSLFALVVITVDRFVSIRFPFRLERLGMTEARVIVAALWVVGVAIAGVPLLAAVDGDLLPYFADFYGRSGVCLALHITADRPNGWQYSVAVFLALNFVLFVVILVSYATMFDVVRRSRRAAAVRSAQMRTDRAMARRMTLIVLTDFFCWLPIIGLGVASLEGANVPAQAFAWVAVFVLPLNAAVNPLLYTISTAPFVGVARKRVYKFKKSFISSLIGSGAGGGGCETRPSNMTSGGNMSFLVTMDGRTGGRTDGRTD